MNDISRDGLAHGAPGLDPELLELFDQAPSVGTDDEAFVRTLLVKLHRARRRRLLARVLLTTLIIVLGALIAPYAAQATLTIADWVTLYYPVGCACAVLIAWRTARRRSRSSC